MKGDAGYREIVWIKDTYRLIDAESYERTYGAANRRTLTPGYYIAQWPPGTENPHFLHDGLVFTGPFKTRQSAIAALQDEQASAYPA
jgi:hypothetical protein